MALYRINHSFVGRSTHAEGTASANARYICRKSATERIRFAFMPGTGPAASKWLLQQELADRKNARVIDKFIISLPRELSLDQNTGAVMDFVKQVTKGRTPYLVSFQNDPDNHNPHAHIIIRDRDIDTGKRVANLSEKGSTRLIRKIWEDSVNLALERAGHDITLSREAKQEVEHTVDSILDIDVDDLSDSKDSPEKVRAFQTAESEYAYYHGALTEYEALLIEQQSRLESLKGNIDAADSKMKALEVRKEELRVLEMDALHFLKDGKPRGTAFSVKLGSWIWSYRSPTRRKAEQYLDQIKLHKSIVEQLERETVDVSSKASELEVDTMKRSLSLAEKERVLGSEEERAEALAVLKHNASQRLMQLDPESIKAAYDAGLIKGEEADRLYSLKADIEQGKGYGF